MLLKCIKLAVFSFYLTSESNGTVFLFSPPPPPPSLGRGYCSLQVKHKLCFCFAFNQFLNGCCPEIVFSPEGTEVGWAFRTIPEHFWVDRQKLQIMDVYPWRAARTITAFLAVTSKCTYAMWERWIFFCTLLGIESLWPLSITVCAVARLDVQETRFWFPAGAWIYLLLEASWSPLAPIQHPFECVWGTSCGGKSAGTWSWPRKRVSRLRMSVALPPLLHMTSWCAQGQRYFGYKWYHISRPIRRTFPPRKMWPKFDLLLMRRG